MKKILLLLILIQQVAICQIENSVFPEVPYSELNAIAVYGDYIYTAGDCNTAIVTNDEGQTWTTIEVDDRIRNIKILPESNGSKAIYQSNDNIYVFDFSTMEFEEISSSSLFLSSGSYISIEADGQSIYVISSRNIHKAAVGQYEWTKIADLNLTGDAVQVTDITDNYLHVGTLEGLFVRVDLNSETVETRNDFMNRIFSFDMVTDDLGYFTIQNFTYPIKTTDGGTTYTDLTSLPENIGVRGYGENVIMTVNTNRIYVSTDAGESAKFIPIPDDGTYDLISSAYIADNGALYFAGRSSMVGKTEDFGESFVNLNAYQRENLTDIALHSSGMGIAVGGNRSIIKTEDGGETWAFVDLSFGTNTYLNSVAILSQNKYIAGGSNELLIIENDEIANSINISIEALYHNADEDYLLALEATDFDYAIIKSTDGGITWDSKAFIPDYGFTIYQAPSGKLYIPSNGGTIYTSTDNGESWEIESFGDNLNIRSLTFLDENIGLGSTSSQLYLTRDGGVTAELISSGYIITNLHFISENQLFYTTANEAQTNIYESTDGGQSFTETKEYCSETLSTFRDENNVIWLAQKGGHINKYRVEGSSSTQRIVLNDLNISPNPIALGQQLNIESDENISKVTFTSFAGQVINVIKPSGTNTISTVGLATGMYLLSMETENGTIKHGKVVITD
ncbi:MAG: YCF48-related protein [Bacteroidota bacterium]